MRFKHILLILLRYMQFSRILFGISIQFLFYLIQGFLIKFFCSIEEIYKNNEKKETFGDCPSPTNCLDAIKDRSYLSTKLNYKCSNCSCTVIARYD